MSRRTAADMEWRHAAKRARLDAGHRQTVASALAEPAKTPPATDATGLGTTIAAENLRRRTLPPEAREAVARRLAAKPRQPPRRPAMSKPKRRDLAAAVREASGPPAPPLAATLQQGGDQRPREPDGRAAGDRRRQEGRQVLLICVPPRIPSAVEADGGRNWTTIAGALRERHRPTGPGSPPRVAAARHGLRHTGSPARETETATHRPAQRHGRPGPGGRPVRKRHGHQAEARSVPRDRVRTAAPPPGDRNGIRIEPDPERRPGPGATRGVDGTAPGSHHAETPIVRVAELRHEGRGSGRLRGGGATRGSLRARRRGHPARGSARA